MYSEYQIRAAIIKVINQALRETGITDYMVLSRNPPNMTHDENVVLVEKINTRRKGFQTKETRYKRISETNGQEKYIFDERYEVWIEEITWQLSVVHKKNVNDTIESMTGEDVVKRIQMWLNSSDGAKKMRARTDVPMAPVHVFQARTQPYSDDSDNHQADEQFDFSIIVLQTWNNNPKFITDWDMEVHHI